MKMNVRSMTACLTAVLSCALFAPSATADVTTTITTAQPTANGSITLTIKDTNGGITSDVTVNGILATDTPAQKATKINNAINAQLTADGPPNSDLFSSTVAGNTVPITKTGGGGMSVTIKTDTTGEGTNLKTQDSGGNGNNSFWRFVRWIFASNDSTVPPGGNTYTINTTNGYSASVLTDGAMTIAQLQSDITAQLELEGVLFTQSIDPGSGAIILTSQYFPVGPSFPIGGVGLDTSAGYSDYLGGIGLDLYTTPEPSSIGLLATGIIGGLLTLRRKIRA